jgi:hypothetical protein
MLSLPKPEDETLTKLLIDFTMEKTDDDKSWDISREILDTGRLVLNEITVLKLLIFRIKPSQTLSKLKETGRKLQSLRKTMPSLRKQL